MSDNTNTPPGSNITPEPPPRRGQDGMLSGDVITLLEKTRPWAMFLAILTFIIAGMTGLGGVFLMGAGGVMAGQAGFEGVVTGVGLGLFYLLSALLYFFPGLYLLRSANAMKDVGIEGADALEASMVHMHKFWRFVGIIALISLIFGVLAVIVLVSTGIAELM